jgi:predicted nucleic acid-binding protein
MLKVRNELNVEHGTFFAVLAFLFGEAGHEKVLTVLGKAADTDSDLLITAPNWAEVRVHRRKKSRPCPMAGSTSEAIGLPIDIVPADQELSELAGELKVTKKMSLADCFAAALAKREKAEVYTGDPKFKAREREIKVVWLPICQVELNTHRSGVMTIPHAHGLASTVEYGKYQGAE